MDAKIALQGFRDIVRHLTLASVFGERKEFLGALSGSLSKKHSQLQLTLDKLLKEYEAMTRETRSLDVQNHHPRPSHTNITIDVRATTYRCARCDSEDHARFRSVAQVADGSWEAIACSPPSGWMLYRDEAVCGSCLEGEKQLAPVTPLKAG
jgi:hypothetical protein